MLAIDGKQRHRIWREIGLTARSLQEDKAISSGRVNSLWNFGGGSANSRAALEKFARRVSAGKRIR